MANRSNDDIAKALQGLASGAHGAPEHSAEDAAPAAPPPAASPAPARPTAVPTPGRSARPSSPSAGPLRPTPAPLVRAQPVAGQRPGSPALPAVPPAQPAAAFVVGDVVTGDADENDSVAMPAPSQEYLAHRPAQTTRGEGSSTAALARSVRFRQTLIPVLLTCGVLMVATTVLKYIVHSDAPLAAMPAWMAALLAVSGLALLAVAGLNMAQVRR